MIEKEVWTAVSPEHVQYKCHLIGDRISFNSGEVLMPWWPKLLLKYDMTKRLEIKPEAGHEPQPAESDVRGFSLLSDLDHLRTRFKGDGFDRFLSSLSAEDQAICRQVQPNNWIPTSTLSRLAVAAAAKLGLPPEALCEHLGQHLAKRHLDTILHSASRFNSPETLFLSAEYIYVSLYSRGELQLVPGGNGHKTILISGACVSSHLTCLRDAAFGRQALLLTGAREVEVRHPTCRATGAAFCAFEVEWK